MTSTVNDSSSKEEPTKPNSWDIYGVSKAPSATDVEAKLLTMLESEKDLLEKSQLHRRKQKINARKAELKARDAQPALERGHA